MRPENPEDEVQPHEVFKLATLVGVERAVVGSLGKLGDAKLFFRREIECEEMAGEIRVARTDEPAQNRSLQIAVDYLNAHDSILPDPAAARSRSRHRSGTGLFGSTIRRL